MKMSKKDFLKFAKNYVSKLDYDCLAIWSAKKIKEFLEDFEDIDDLEGALIDMGYESSIY